MKEGCTMKEELRQLAAPQEEIRFGRAPGKNSRRFLAFLICIGMLTSAFALSGVWMYRDGFWRLPEEDKAEQTDENDSAANEDPTQQAPAEQPDDPPAEETVPEGAIPVVSLDLSYTRSETSLLQNQTAYDPNVDALKNSSLFCNANGSYGPLVLILHTHASEAYLEAEASYVAGEVGKQIYSEESSRSVISVGRALCETLNENGVPAVQCTEKHGKDGTLQNSYAGAAACIAAYLKKYPSIQYVIDLHRDGILNSEGALVRTEVSENEEGYGQIMAVVGTDGNGTSCPSWQSNLSLALQLYSGLHSRVENICRPISLRNASYNQELAPYSLLLEIGSAGNTQAEAIRSAKLVGAVLAALINNARQ